MLADGPSIWAWGGASPILPRLLLGICCLCIRVFFLLFFFFFSNLCLGYLLDSVVLFQDVEFRCVPVYCFTKASFTKLDFCGVPWLVGSEEAICFFKISKLKFPWQVDLWGGDKAIMMRYHKFLCYFFPVRSLIQIMRVFPPDNSFSCFWRSIS
jgi:hypothetical protein